MKPIIVGLYLLFISAVSAVANPTSDTIISRIDIGKSVRVAEIKPDSASETYVEIRYRHLLSNQIADWRFIHIPKADIKDVCKNLGHAILVLDNTQSGYFYKKGDLIFQIYPTIDLLQVKLNAKEGGYTSLEKSDAQKLLKYLEGLK